MATNSESRAKFRFLDMKQYRENLIENMKMHLMAVEAGDYSFNNPTFVWGPPGIGKSMILLSICRDTWYNAKSEKGEKRFDKNWLNFIRPWDASQWAFYSEKDRAILLTNPDGWVLMDVRLSQIDPVEIKGAPYYDQKNNKASFLRFSSILPDPDFPLPVFLLLDELPLAPDMVQSAGYQLVNDRKVGDYRLPHKCVIVAAGNREEDGGVHNVMSPALESRFDHIGLEVDHDGFVKYISKGHGFDETMVAFLQFSKEQDKECLYKMEAGAGNFPTFRSWEKALRKVKYGKKEYDAIADSVGKAAAAKFEQFKEITKDIPDAKVLVEKKIYYKEIPLQLVASQKVGNSLLNSDIVDKMKPAEAFNYFRYFVDMKNPDDETDNREELTILFLVNIKDQLETMDLVNKGYIDAIKKGTIKREKNEETGDWIDDLYSLIFYKWRSLAEEF